ncbi:MAG: cysteine--tRNA ligase, partial [Proteobacteria bacterium]
MTDPQPLKLYNTLTRKEDPFRPLDPNLVRIYCCGPTVYAYQHIGNFKTFLFEDILIRTLRFAGYKVKHVMNITDVGHLVSDADDGEDKMLVAARREKKKSFEIAEYYTNKFFEDWDKLGLVRPDVVCKATDHIKEMIELIQRIEKQGFTYLSGGNVYFDVSKFPAYGKLALLDLEKLKAGARIEVDKNKRNAHDFVLWFTKSKFENQELIWDSPWGPGYPGWHIECSAMAIKHLGEVFDIHCGGVDH